MTPTTLLLLTPLLLIPLLLLLLLQPKRKPTPTNPPPSPPGLPFIGNLHQIGLRLHRSFSHLSQKHGPLILLHLGSIPTLIVSSPSSAQQIMRTHDLSFASRPSPKASRILNYNNNGMALAPYGEPWRQIRKICVTNLLSVKMVQSFSGVRMEEVCLMMERIRGDSGNGGVVCLSDALNSLACGVLCKSVFGSGMDDGKRRYLCELIHGNVALFEKFFFEDYFPGLGWLDVVLGFEGRLVRHAEKWDALLEEFIGEHKRRLEEGGGASSADFIDVILQLQGDSSLAFGIKNENIKGLLLDMIAAGTDTSFVTLEWAMAELIRNPEVMEKAQNEVRGIANGEEIVKEEQLSKMLFLKAVIKEVLRLHPPAPLLLPRQSLHDCQIQEYTILKETRVFINAWAIGRDELYWKEPQKFKPERFLNGDVDYKGNDFHYIPFGAGRRICPGIQFAIVAIELALANLLHRFNWKLPSGISFDEMDMNEGPGLISTKREKLELVALPV